MKLPGVVFSLLLWAVAFPTTVPAAVEIYAADAAHSSVGFSIRQLFTRLPGSFRKFEATIRIDADQIERSSVEAAIAIDSIDTGDHERDAHLQKREFFEAAKHPAIIFKSTAWKRTAGNEFDVTGDLTIKGVTKSVVLKVRSIGPSAAPGPLRASWEAKAKIGRHDFGVSAFGKVVGADVEISIRLEAVRKP